MKQMRKKELEDLITSLYCEHISYIYEMDYLDLPEEKKLNIVVEYPYIKVEWHFDNLEPISDIEEAISDIEFRIRSYFIWDILQMTSGNLKVRYWEFEKVQHIARIYIESAYEIIE